MNLEEIKNVIQRYRPYGADIKETRPYSPCREACPANTDVQAYVGLIAQGRYNEAFDVITSVNPVASVCSLICHHPCEQECRRGAIDDPVAVRQLKRFAIEASRDYRRSLRKPVDKTRNKSIGIVGSGPSGLAAGSDLASLGYNVTIYERHPVLGGMLAMAIPPYRLPRESINEDIDDILAKGIDYVTNCEIGKDIKLAELTKKHDAVLIAIGLAKSRSLGIPGLEGPGVLLAIPFLEDIARGKKPAISDNVLVIGGGNVAIDVARSARRLGAANVSMVCLESALEMPAWKWEVDEALEEGIAIHHRWGPKAVRRDGDKVLGLELKKVTSVFDQQGRFSPAYDEETTSFIAANTIIITIGQMSDYGLLVDSPVKLDERGRLQWNPATQMSNVPGVFLAGEVVTGPGSAIAAVESGHRAAVAMHLYLQGENAEAIMPAEKKTKLGEIPEEVAARIACEKRVSIRHLAADVRCHTFEHFELGYTEGEALIEAGRCRGCSGGALVDTKKCMACLTCQRICPYEAPLVQAYSEIRPDLCQACGLCAPECPAQAITMVSYDIRQLRTEMPTRLANIPRERTEPAIASFMCTHHVGVAGFNLPANFHILPVHCISRVDILDLLSALAYGADGVAVVGCGAAICKYKDIENRVQARLKRAQDLSRGLGIESGRIALLNAMADAEDPYLQVCSGFAQTLLQLGLRTARSTSAHQ